jgi:hypothetical protein
MTALDVAFASVVVTGIVGVVTPWVQWLIAKRTQEHEQLLARESRIHEDEARVCTQALHDGHRWVSYMNKFYEWQLNPDGPDPGLPVLPDPLSEQELRRTAELSAFASQEVVDAYETLLRAGFRFITESPKSDLLRAGGDAAQAALAASDQRREECQEALKELARYVRADLRR